MFELQSHKLKPQCPRMEDQALPTHPCPWWLFLHPSPSFSLSPSSVQRWGCWSPELGLDLAQQNNGSVERERPGEKPPTPRLGPQDCGAPAMTQPRCLSIHPWAPHPSIPNLPFHRHQQKNTPSCSAICVPVGREQPLNQTALGEGRRVFVLPHVGDFLIYFPATGGSRRGGLGSASRVPAAGISQAAATQKVSFLH